MGTNQHWNWRVTALRTRGHGLDHPIMNFEMTIRADCTVYACNPPPFTYKSSYPLIVTGGMGREPAFGQKPSFTPHHIPPQLLTSKIKQIFLSTNLSSLLTFEQWAAGPHFQEQCYNINEPRSNYSKRNKPVTKSQISYDSIYMRPQGIFVSLDYYNKIA